jgi:hypothetical protein
MSPQTGPDVVVVSVSVGELISVDELISVGELDSVGALVSTVVAVVAVVSVGSVVASLVDVLLASASVSWPGYFQSKMQPGAEATRATRTTGRRMADRASSGTRVLTSRSAASCGLSCAGPRAYHAAAEDR